MDRTFFDYFSSPFLFSDMFLINPIVSVSCVFLCTLRRYASICFALILNILLLVVQTCDLHFAVVVRIIMQYF